MNTEGMINATKLYRLIAVFLMSYLLISVPLSAYDNKSEGQMKDTAESLAHQHGGQASAGSLIKVSRMMGKSVKNGEGEDFGEITDVAIDRGSGQALYAVLKTGIIDKEFYAVPIKALQLTEKGDGEVILDITQEKLENAKSFEEENWPMMANEELNTGMTEFSRFGEDGEEMQKETNK